ncbi:MAG: alpha/beta hydrolase [Candidatus Saccharimonadia bacterium]
MKNAIILHGMPSKQEYYDTKAPSMSNAHWIPWLQGQLLKHDIWAATPEVPNPYDPKWDLWVKEVERFDLTPETILVGHSLGGSFWLKYLSEHNDMKVGKVVLIAPSGLGWDGKALFDEFTIDPGLFERTKGMTIFNSDNDHKSIQQSVKEIRQQIPDIRYKEFHLGHFTSGSMKTTEFPELLDETLK